MRIKGTFFKEKVKMQKSLFNKLENSNFGFFVVFNVKSRRAQVWVETAIYTLIGLAIIGIVLAIVTPAIDKYKDEIILEQTITVLNSLNDKIIDVRDLGAGNKRIVPELRIKKGEIKIDGIGEKIIYVLKESRLEYSEVGQEIRQGDITIKTEEKGKKYDITLSLSYSDIDLSFNGKNEEKILQATTIPYKISIENNGVSGNKVQVAIMELS